MGDKLGMSTSKVSRIETGRSGLQADDVLTLLGFYQVHGNRRAELMDLLRRGDEKGWWERQPGLPTLWRALIDFEAKALRIQNYESLLIPGLLQTAEYASAILQALESTLSAAEVDNLVASRMARQAILTRSSAPNYLAIMHEAAVRLPVGGPGVMARQLRWLQEMNERPSVSVRLVPISAGANAGLRGGFMVLEFGDEPALVFAENQETALFQEEEADLAGYRLALRNILNVALAPDATAERLSAIVAEMST
ncbi:helix-turn-helix transcriptional regulator [Actinokineospora auranticolor]|uniref:helix-turn-helix domain-containing protein n=1 Tax=Actinokineospora auranticolor TaxID=155976 RepID=UPI001FE72CE0|nr:helix-turn-helix transcriptional regulator [Actinokineospora auranticolor]